MVEKNKGCSKISIEEGVECVTTETYGVSECSDFDELATDIIPEKHSGVSSAKTMTHPSDNKPMERFFTVVAILTLMGFILWFFILDTDPQPVSPPRKIKIQYLLINQNGTQLDQASYCKENNAKLWSINQYKKQIYFKEKEVVWFQEGVYVLSEYKRPEKLPYGTKNIRARAVCLISTSHP